MMIRNLIQVKCLIVMLLCIAKGYVRKYARLVLLALDMIFIEK